MMMRAGTISLWALGLIVLNLVITPYAESAEHPDAENIATRGDQSCDNIPGPSSGLYEDCCECQYGILFCLLINRAGATGTVSAEQVEYTDSPFGVKLLLSQGFSSVIDSGTEGLGSTPSGCGSCGAAGSIPIQSQLLRAWWPRYWRSNWTHDGSLGRGMYGTYDYYVLKATDVIEFRDPNTGFVERFVKSNGNFIAAPGFNYRSLITEATATHVTIRQPGGLKLRFEVTSYVQNGAGNRCRIQYMEDRNGNRINFSYVDPATTANANVMKWTTATDPYGRSISFSYIVWNGLNVLDRVTLADGRTIDYTYTADNSRFVHKIEYGTGGTPSGIESTWYATTSVKVNEALLPADHYFWEATLSSSAYGRVRGIQRFDGNYAYARSVTEDAAGVVTTLSWDQDVVKEVSRSMDRQLISSRKQHLDGTWETDIDYTAANRLPPTAYVQPAEAGVPQRTTSVQRDPATDMVTQRTHADATVDQYEYNAFNQVTRHIDRNGDEQTWTYDASGNLLTHTVAVGTAVQADEHWTYNAKGQILSYEDYNGNVTSYEYYAAMHASQFELEKIILPNGPSQPAGEITFTYDDFGRVKTVTDPVGRTATFSYDAAGRHIQTTYPDTSTETTTYGTAANSARVLETKDRNGNRTVYSYDNTGRVETVEVLEAGSNDLMQITTNTYDLPTGLLIKSDTDGDFTDYEYDYKNRLIKTTVHPSSTKSLVRESVYNRYRPKEWSGRRTKAIALDTSGN